MTAIKTLLRAAPWIGKLLVVCLPLFASYSLVAFASCESEVTQISDWNSLPALSEIPLKEKFLIDLSRHPIVQRLSEKYGNKGGANLAFEFDIIEVGGWKIQANFLKKVLAAIFPQARFDVSNNLPLHVRKIKIKFTDSAREAEEARSGRIDMSLLKPANPGPQLADKLELRRQLNLPQNARIAHIYDASDDRKIRETAIRSLLSQGLADVIVVSTRNTFSYIQPSVDYSGQEIQAAHLPYQDSASRPEIPPDAKPIIFNSTQQRMPVLFAAADYGVVLGRGNIFEAAAEGRPLYLWADPYQSEDRLWAGMMETVTGTFGAHVFTEISALPRLVAETSTQPPVMSPYEVRRSQGKSALDRLLERIQSAIEN